ncbi:hypothetical protein ACEQ6C_39035, partial [Rhizobium ruizarguesonis]
MDSITEEATFNEIACIITTSLDPETIQHKLGELLDVEDVKVTPVSNDSLDDLTVSLTEAKKDVEQKNKNPIKSEKE